VLPAKQYPRTVYNFPTRPERGRQVDSKVTELVDFSVARILDLLETDNNLALTGGQ